VKNLQADTPLLQRGNGVTGWSLRRYYADFERRRKIKHDYDYYSRVANETGEGYYLSIKEDE